jgi:hypothetical protein
MNDIFDEQRNIPFFGSSRDLEELTALVENCLNILREASSIRQMVLETWLIVDYAVRQFLLAGFELKRFCDNDFDLQYKLLPREFSALIELLEYTIKFNNKLPTESETKKVDRDRVGGFTASYEFLKFVRDRYPELLGRINEVQQDYIATQNPDPSRSEGFVSLPGIYPYEERKVTRMRPEWRKVACALDDNWFALARQLNKARNIAAHSFRTEETAQAFGLVGPNVLTLAKDKCLSIITILLGLKEETAR